VVSAVADRPAVAAVAVGVGEGWWSWFSVCLCQVLYHLSAEALDMVVFHF
jgi:uncharacterized membrane protein YbjE (DUF340 family)